MCLSVNFELMDVDYASSDDFGVDWGFSLGYLEMLTAKWEFSGSLLSFGNNREFDLLYFRSAVDWLFCAWFGKDC